MVIFDLPRSVSLICAGQPLVVRDDLPIAGWGDRPEYTVDACVSLLANEKAKIVVSINGLVCLSWTGALRRIGALPDKTVFATRTAAGIHMGSGGESAEIALEAAARIFVRRL